MAVTTCGGGDEFFRRGEVEDPRRYRLDMFVPYLPNLGKIPLKDVVLDRYPDFTSGQPGESLGPPDRFSEN